jgi:quercetin dioxygenase-like cupin family protein
MRFRTTMIGSAFVFIAVAALWVARTSAAASPASEGVIHIVSQQPLAGQTDTDVTILTVDYPPGGSTPPHQHPGTTYAYVLQGAVVSQVNDGPTQTFNTGRRGPSSRTIIT